MKILRVTKVTEIILTGDDADIIVSNTGNIIEGMKSESYIAIYTDTGKMIKRNIEVNWEDEERIMKEYYGMVHAIAKGNLIET
jgi:hypothetical protein